MHNLALQGVRPLAGHPSSLSAWFPKLTLPVEDICDPRYPDCYNPMRAGIVLADRVHVVSPGYASEVLLPDALELGRHGGEGLEQDLAERSAEGDLHGILNGCEYPGVGAGEAAAPGDAVVSGETVASEQGHDLSRARAQLAIAMRDQLAEWFRQYPQLRSSDYLADKTLAATGERLDRAPQDCFLVTSVGRVTEQKVGLLLCEVSAAAVPDADAGMRYTLLDSMLMLLGERGLLVLLVLPLSIFPTKKRINGRRRFGTARSALP